MELWRVEVEITHPTQRRKKEFGFYPAPSLQEAIGLAEWVDTLYPPIPPFIEQNREYSARQATAIERDTWLANIEAEGN